MKKHSSLLNKYTLMYEKKPRSRVFAPLAETYRKLGMIDESLKILKEGIKNHPSYTLGYIVLAHCYFDMQNYEMAYNTIRPFVAQNLENITLQKLFAKTCINLGHLEEALQTFKYLLLINPKDQYVADQIKLLEDDLLAVDEEDIEEESDTNSYSFDDDEWVQVSFASKNNQGSDDSLENIAQEWEVNKKSPLEEFKSEVSASNIQVKEHKLDDDYFHEDFDNKADDVITAIEDNLEESVDKNTPIITHTLVDLYANQGHYDKGIEILKNILVLHPDDKASAEKLIELEQRRKELIVGDIDNIDTSITENNEKTDNESVPPSDNENVLILENELLIANQEKYKKIESIFEKFLDMTKEKQAAL